MELARSFYLEHDALGAANALLGKVLYTRLDGVITGGIITETEAYMGVGDRASHAFGGKRTARNEQMYAVGGTAYVYLCYGIHHLFNVVVLSAEIPHAVLIRAVVPFVGTSTMLKRYSNPHTNGPGKLTRALAVHLDDNGTDLTGQRIWIEDAGIVVPPEHVMVGPRVGVDYAGTHALLPYRFRIAPSQLIRT